MRRCVCTVLAIAKRTESPPRGSDLSIQAGVHFNQGQDKTVWNWKQAPEVSLSMGLKPVDPLGCLFVSGSLGVLVNTKTGHFVPQCGFYFGLEL